MGTPTRGEKFTPAQCARPLAEGRSELLAQGVSTPTPPRGQVKEVPFQLFQELEWSYGGAVVGFVAPAPQLLSN